MKPPTLAVKRYRQTQTQAQTPFFLIRGWSRWMYSAVKLRLIDAVKNQELLLGLEFGAEQTDIIGSTVADRRETQIMFEILSVSS